MPAPVSSSNRPSVAAALDRFLPVLAGERLSAPQQRARWAITHCRTAAMGGHLHACTSCGKRHFHYHSCGHRSCPRCGATGNADWTARQLARQLPAPYFMVTFTLPGELRGYFAGVHEKKIHDAFFQAASRALKDLLASPRHLGASRSGFTMVLHTWNQQLNFHPHLHAIVPGAGLDSGSQPVTVKSPQFLVPVPAIRSRLRTLMFQALDTLQKEHPGHLQALPQGLLEKDWGVDIRPFGNGANAIKYLGAYVCKNAIGDGRIKAITGESITFTYKDRSDHNKQKTRTLSGPDFVHRYLRHALPKGLRSIRHYGYLHPAAKKAYQRLRFLLGGTLQLDASPRNKTRAASAPIHCRHCNKPLMVLRIPAQWKQPRARPPT